MPVRRVHSVPDDFEAVIRIFAANEGGRTSSAFNGIRWAFAYAENQPEGELYEIFPDFFDEEGNSLPTDRPLPVGRDLPARMVVLFDEMREKVHRGRIREGVRFLCHEGPKRVAEGRVTRVTGLFKNRPKPKNVA